MESAANEFSAQSTGVDAPATYLPAIRAAAADPKALEDLHAAARRDHAADRFAADLLTAYHAQPENLLYAAWFYRLGGALPARQVAYWQQAIPLSILLGLALWLLSAPGLKFELHTASGGEMYFPYLALLWAPVTAAFIIGFLAFAVRQHAARAGLVIAGLAALTAYVVFVPGLRSSATQTSYLTLMLAHVPLLAWCGLGLFVLGWGSSALNRFAFLTKSIEVIGTAGVAAIVGVIFVGLTVALFQALGINLDQNVARIFLVGGGGLIPVLAVAAVYDPALSPGEQEFRRGFGRILVVILQALLPLALLMLVVYVAFIPFNFGQPFTHRDVLIVYNVLLFAAMGLLLGVTPIAAGEVAPRLARWLRLGIIAVAALVTLVSLYALAAVVYRTTQGALTMNRLAVIGWNLANIVILVALLLKQARAGREGWVAALQSTFRFGTAVYLAWGLLLTLALPWLF
ncbi:MAG TPA: hypothetical protein VID73_05390 [Ktedonobacterales bacterium]